MATTFTAPIIDANGLTVPDYEVVREELKNTMRGIFGQDIYLESDSQDGQMVALFALAVHDYFSALVAAYDSRGPSTAQGVGLSSVVKINGISRDVPGFSKVDLVIVGQVGATIIDGAVADEAGTKWFLDSEVVVIPNTGEITVSATAEKLGAVQAPANTIVNIATPQRGWESVNNPLAAVPGARVESDAALKVRQSISTMIPSVTILEGMVGAVADLEGVRRYKPYENDSDETDANGLPPHTISMVVEGGDQTEIANTIFAKKTPGVSTFGTTSVVVTDAYGIPHSIKFYRPTNVVIDVAISLKALAGYTLTVEDAIKSTVTAWTNNLDIGADVVFTRVFVPANLGMPFKLDEAGEPELMDPDEEALADRKLRERNAKTYEIVSLTLRRDADPLDEADVEIAFNEAATTTTANITVTVLP